MHFLSAGFIAPELCRGDFFFNKNHKNYKSEKVPSKEICLNLQPKIIVFIKNII
jgi:hypothetical protein